MKASAGEFRKTVCWHKTKLRAADLGQLRFWIVFGISDPESNFTEPAGKRTSGLFPKQGRTDKKSGKKQLFSYSRILGTGISGRGSRDGDKEFG